MQLKSFSAPSTKEVLARIKEELGPDAVILDTVEEDGLITMTAALERTPPPPRPRAAFGNEGDDAGGAESAGAATGDAPAAAFEPLGGRVERFQAPPLAARQDIPAPGFEVAPRLPRPGPAARPAPEAGDAAREYGAMPPGWQQWHEEWSSIKNHILALMKPAMRLDKLPPRQRLAIEFLQREGVEDAAVLQLYQRLEGDPSASILVPLSRMVPVRPWSVENWPQRIQVIAGPFGAGKTSVAIRLALSLRKSEPGCRICLVNADATRGNGRLLLRHYCDLSDMAYKEASTTLELVSSLNQALREGFDKVVVDLPGLSRGRYLTTLLSDAGLAELTGESRDDLAVHLALPPHYGTLQLKGILERYRTPHAGSIIWTKLDEAEHYGQLVNVAVHTGLPVSALSFGPGLGNSLAPAKENMLWRLLFKRELPVGSY